MFQWLYDWLEKFKDWIIDFFKWALGYAVDQILSAILWIIQQIPVPDFVENANIGDYIDADILWMLNQASVGEAFLIMAAGITFYMLRRIMTLGIW